jgi:hypothetical protein
MEALMNLSCGGKEAHSHKGIWAQRRKCAKSQRESIYSFAHLPLDLFEPLSLFPFAPLCRSAVIPFSAFQVVSEKELIDLQKRAEKELSEEEKPERVILCRNCRHQITSHKDIIDVNGHHRHVFNNPEGILFEIGCFSAADGCINHGTPTLEFTWFPGFSWRFSVCANCMMHLGWQYQLKCKEKFWGLILTHLVEGI